MQELAYDKDANPFRFARRTRTLRVRRWKNAGQRGTCAIVLDGDGEPLVVPAEVAHKAFLKAVNHVPGFYRLDQCDQDGLVVDDAPPAYLEIEGQRNAASSGDLDPRDSVIRDLAQINAEMCRSITEGFGTMMQATADILRAADGAGLPRREAPPPLPPLPKADNKNNDDDDDDDDDEYDDEDDDSRPEPSERLLAIIEQMMPTLQMWLASLAAKRSSSLPPATMPYAPEPAAPPPPASSAAPDVRGVVAGVRSSASIAPDAIPDHGAPPPMTTIGSIFAPADAATANLAPNGDEPTTALPTTNPAPHAATGEQLAADGARNALAAEPTQEQWAHLISVRAHLTPREAAIAEAVVVRMTPAIRVQWLSELATLSPPQAAELVRSMIPKRAPRPRAPRPDATPPNDLTQPAPAREESEE